MKKPGVAVHQLLKFVLLAIFLSFLNTSIAQAQQYSLAIAAIFQNERPYLKEWIEFHRLVGVEHFYLYNNLSTDHPEEILEPYIKAGIVELIDWSFDFTARKQWKSIQSNAYNDALRRAQDHAQWVAFIDADEFLFPTKENTLQDVLKGFEDFGGIAVNWQCFGTSHVAKIPKNKLLIETLIYKAPVNHKRNLVIKSIVQPKLVECFGDNFRSRVHSPLFKKGAFNVDTNKKKSLGCKSSQVLIDKLRLNHYWTRDEEYFYTRKLASRDKRGLSIKFDQLAAAKLNQKKDATILRFVPALKKRLEAVK